MKTQGTFARFGAARLSLAILLLAIGPFAARAQTTYTNAATGPWQTPSTWTANSGYPVAGDTAIITNGYTVTTTAGDAARNLDVGGATLSQLTIGGNLTLVRLAPTLYNFTIGNAASTRGKVVHQSGDVTNDSPLDMAVAASSTAEYEMTGGSLSLTDSSRGFLRVGVSGTGTFTQAGSSTVTLSRSSATAEAFVLGNNAGGNGTYTMSGGTLNAVLAVSFIGLNGRGTMTIDGTAQANLRNVVLGRSSSSTGTLNLSGGTLRANSLTNGGGTGTFNFSGGTLAPFNTNATIGSATTNNNTTITLSGTNATISSSGTGGVARTVTIFSQLTGTGAVTFAGNGTNVLRAANTYTGSTTVSAGTLALGPSGSIGGSPLITLAAGATLDAGAGFALASSQTLAGAGTVLSNITVDGAVSPGVVGIGALTTSNVTWNAGVAWPYDLGPSASSDLLAINGAFTKGTGSGWAFDLQSVGSAGVYTLVTWSAETDFASGDFSANNVPGGLTPTFAVNANELTLTLSSGGGGPVLVVTPASHEFGAVEVDETVNFAFTVTNTGTATLEGTATVSGVGFDVAAGSPFSVSAGGSTTVTVSFTPALPEDYSGEVVFASNGGGSTNALTGQGFLLAGSTNSSIKLLGGQVTLGFGLASGALYHVQANADLLDGAGWSNITEQLTNRTGDAVLYNDPASPPAPVRMYRVTSP